MGRFGSTGGASPPYDLEDRLTSESRGSSTIIYAWADRGALTRKTVDGVPTDYYTDFQGRITRTICAPASVDWLYTYAPTGDRMKKANLVTPFNSEHYLPSDGDTLCDFTTSSGSEVETGVYVSPGVDGRVARIDPTKGSSDPLRTTYYFGDALQSVLQVTNASGFEIRKQFTDAWGNDIAGVGSGSSGNAGDRYGFTGRENDAESGLMHYRARSYDPMVGRFTSRDPVPYSNLYIYVQNNPVNSTDPSGLIPAEEAKRLEHLMGRAREQGRTELADVYENRLFHERRKDKLYDTDRKAYEGQEGQDALNTIAWLKKRQAELEDEAWVLAIHSDSAEGSQTDPNLPDGHAWLTAYNEVTEDFQSIGLWPDSHFTVTQHHREGAPGNIQVDLWPDTTEAPYWYAERITAEGISKLRSIIADGAGWTYSNSCASFASETFEAVTGRDVDADDFWGIESPRELGEHILELNHGSPTPATTSVRIPKAGPDGKGGFQGKSPEGVSRSSCGSFSWAIAPCFSVKGATCGWGHDGCYNK